MDNSCKGDTGETVDLLAIITEVRDKRTSLKTNRHVSIDHKVVCQETYPVLVANEVFDYEGAQNIASDR